MRKAYIPIALAMILAALASCGGPSPSQGGSPRRQDGYSLRYSKGFKPGSSFVDDVGISIVLIQDVSGSMSEAPQSGGEAKYVQATGALLTVANFLEGLGARQKDLPIKVAILKFSNEVSTVLPLTLMDKAGLARLKAIASNPSNFNPDGGTAIGKAIEAGSEILSGSGTILKSMIVITDGENNASPDPRDVIDAIYGDRNTASTADIRVNTDTQLLSFIGFDVDNGQFGDYAKLGARVTATDDQAGLENSLKSLLEADITKLESK
jgi:hypothetical protein